MEEKPNYYAIIPANVRYNKNLNSSQKLFYGEITCLTQKTGECWASNSYFSQLYEVSPSSISNWVKTLEKENLIDVDYIRNGKEIEKRIIKLKGIQNTDYLVNILNGGSQNIEEGYSKNLKENNTSINNTRIILQDKEIQKKTYFTNIELNDLFIEFLNQRKKLKAVNSELAIKNLLSKLNEYPDEVKIEMINQSITNSWKGVFPLKGTSKKKDNSDIQWEILKKIESGEITYESKNN